MTLDRNHHRSPNGLPTQPNQVNMTDLSPAKPQSLPAASPAAPTRAAPAAGARAGSPAGPSFELIELLFFAYRDFIGDPDAILDQFSFGRAHHRVLHFVNRNPGMSVAELLDILKITKQSLGRVLKELVEAGYILQQTGAADRRQRLLFATPLGANLALQLAEPQSRRIRQALAALGPEGEETARRFLALMINEADRAQATRFAAKP